MRPLLDHLLTAPPPPSPTTAEAWARHYEALPAAGPDRAILGGFGGDRPAWAFASGYRAALDALLPTANRRAALCITEAGGNHPRAVAAHVEDGALRGEKRFVFLGPLAERLFVLARSGAEYDGRPLLRIYAVEADAPGVRLMPGPPASVVPELPHSGLYLDTPAPEPLGGDGWARYARPFRTVEDIHVTLGLLGWGLRLARGLPAEVAEGLLPPLLALRALATLDPRESATHRALAPGLSLAWAALEGLPWTELGPAADLWARDRVILQIGEPARKRRLALARQADQRGT